MDIESFVQVVELREPIFHFAVVTLLDLTLSCHIAKDSSCGRQKAKPEDGKSTI